MYSKNIYSFTFNFIRKLSSHRQIYEKHKLMSALFKISEWLTRVTEDRGALIVFENKSVH